MQAQFQYWHHSDVNVPLKLKIDRLYLSWIGFSHNAIRTVDLNVHLILDGVTHGSPIPVGRFHFDKDGTSVDKFIIFPICVRDLPLDSLILFEIIPVDGRDPIFATIPLFSKRTVLRQSRQLLVLQEGHKINLNSNSPRQNLKDSTAVAIASLGDFQELPLALKLDKLLDLYHRKLIPESYNMLDSRVLDVSLSFVSSTIQTTRDIQGLSMICVYLPILAYSVIYAEMGYSRSTFGNATTANGHQISHFIDKLAADAGAELYSESPFGNMSGVPEEVLRLINTRFIFPDRLKSEFAGVDDSLLVFHPCPKGELKSNVIENTLSQQTFTPKRPPHSFSSPLFTSWSHAANLFNSSSSHHNVPSSNSKKQVALKNPRNPFYSSLSHSSMKPTYIIDDLGAAGESALATRQTRLQRNAVNFHNNTSTTQNVGAGGINDGSLEMLRPNQSQRAQLDKIVSLARRSLSPTEKNLVWMFRHSLMADAAALPVFLQSCEMHEDSDRAEAHALLARWSRPGIADSLRLLSNDFSDPVIRSYAVVTVGLATDAELDIYLLQLVQSIRYDNTGDKLANNTSLDPSTTSTSNSKVSKPDPTDLLMSISSPTHSGLLHSAAANPQSPLHDGVSPANTDSTPSSCGPLADLLIQRASTSERLASNLHWFLLSEALGESDDAPCFAKCLRTLESTLKMTAVGRLIRDRLRLQRLLRSKLLAIVVAMQAVRGAERKKVVMRSLMSDPVKSMVEMILLIKSEPSMVVCETLSPLFDQQIDRTERSNDQTPALNNLSTSMMSEGGNEKLLNSNNAIATAVNSTVVNLNSPSEADSHLYAERLDFTKERSETETPVPYPLDADWGIVHIESESCTVFRSAMFPILVTCTIRKLKPAVVYLLELEEFTALGLKEPVSVYLPDSEETRKTARFIFKAGDDLRQDQLIMQLFRWGDGILQMRGLDLKLSPYNIIAFSPTDGMVEFVDNSKPVADVLREFSDIKSFFKAKNQLTANGEIPHHVNDAYVRSCAGYCVLTYLLGVGDRHLDNLLLTSDGKICHIDFGFIFGHDPKPWPPPMRLNRQMVDALDGVRSPRFALFRRFCSEAYRYIRREAKLLLSMIELMSDSGIKDLGKKPQLALEKTLEKFRLDVDEMFAEHLLQTKVINESVGAVLPELYDYVHSVANFLKG